MKFLIPLVLAVAFVAADTDLEEFKTGTKIFTGDVYKQVLLDNDKNFLVSPFSADVIWALCQSGAEDVTGEEIRTAFHLPNTKKSVEEDFRSILPTIQSDYVTLVSANKMYVENNFPIKEDFKKVATEIYQADFQNIAFEENQKAAEEINKWVEEQTANKIQDFMSPDDLDASTVFVLINALYFQGNWSTPFQPQFTKKAKFYTSEEATVDATTMFQESVEYNYAESEELDAQILEVPFQGEEATITFILPNKKEGIAVLEKQVEKVLTTPSFTRESVQVVLPKFKIETTVDFKDVLQKLGVKKAFNMGEADFSGISGEPGDLFIAHSKQKTYISVSELGVEAAAVTEIAGEESLPPKPTKYFTADHPFIFYLKVKDIILFEGRVLEPQFE